ncbi:hypothetical protein, partial [Ralstonia solanacearum]|uniref:hypothetical protein n=1 Tax=Ralstonia solanacearum TaxID=305 RepID=UPI000AB56A2D
MQRIASARIIGGLQRVGRLPAVPALRSDRLLPGGARPRRINRMGEGRTAGTGTQPAGAHAAPRTHGARPARHIASGTPFACTARLPIA